MREELLRGREMETDFYICACPNCSCEAWVDTEGFICGACRDDPWCSSKHSMDNKSRNHGMGNKQKFAAFNREERLVLYNALCAYTKSCSLVDERALRLGASPGSDYDVADRLWDELRHEGMGPVYSEQCGDP